MTFSECPWGFRAPSPAELGNEGLGHPGAEKTTWGGKKGSQVGVRLQGLE